MSQEVRRGRPQPGNALNQDRNHSVHGDLVLRCVWLRAHASLLCDVDDSGLLSAQLLDFADLLEVSEREGWFS